MDYILGKLPYDTFAKSSLINMGLKFCAFLQNNGKCFNAPYSFHVCLKFPGRNLLLMKFLGLDSFMDCVLD